MRLSTLPGSGLDEPGMANEIPRMLSLTVNGRLYQVPFIAGETLAELLRERLGLTGTKIGCNEAECGACTLLVNDEPVMSCSYPAGRAHGKAVLTIEGLSPGLLQGEEIQALHPLQEAFISYGAVQCGFCTPGQLMTAYALLKRNPCPTQSEIRRAMAGVLCRCGCYAAIERAIQAAAENLQSGTLIKAPDLPLGKPGHHQVGKAQIRPDATAKVTGEAKYTDDLHFPAMLFARVKRAALPHAILRVLDISQARALQGVRAVLTAEDLPGAPKHGLETVDWPILVGVGEQVRYMGDARAIVAADTPAIATMALKLITADYDRLPVIKDAVDARQPDAPQLHASGNLLKHIQVRQGDLQKGFTDAELVLEHTFYTSTAEHLFMEPECSLARLTAGSQMEIYVGSQIPYSDRQQVADALGWPEERVRIVGQTVGGAFGGKEDIAGQIHAALLAQATGRPVKLLFDRHESLLVHPKRHATQIHLCIGARRDGKITAIQTELLGDTGAYASLGEMVMERATTHSTGPYAIPNVSADCFAMYTNNPPSGAFRGFGVTQSAFAIESLMDMLANSLGLDPLELRRRNALQAGCVTSTGQLLRESVGLLECIQKVEAEMKRRGGEQPFRARPEGHLRTAWGFAVGYKNTGFGMGARDAAIAEVEILADGSLEVRTSSAEVGQGLATVLQLIAAEELGALPGSVRVRLMDTDLTPDGGATTASRQTYVSGNAVRLASQALRKAISGVLAEKFDLPPQGITFTGSGVQAGGRQISFASLAEIMKAEGRSPCVHYEYQAPETRPLGAGGDAHIAFSFAAQAAEVEVDVRTGEVTVRQVIAANDVGRCLNPLGLQGQAEGGVIMGMGGALLENYIIDDGVVFTDRMARYRIPTMLQTPQITIFVVEQPTRDGPYGAKGVGEIAGIPTAPAITNAIYHAVGVRVDRLPVDHELIWKELQRINNRASA